MQQQPTHGNQQTERPGPVGASFPVQLPRGEPERLPTLHEWNSRYIEYVLNHTKGKKTAAARILGINRRTLYRRKKSQTGGQANGVDSSIMSDVPPRSEMQ